MTNMLHSYGFRQFHKTWNGENLSNDFRDMCSANSGAAFWPSAHPAKKRYDNTKSEDVRGKNIPYFLLDHGEL